MTIATRSIPMSLLREVFVSAIADEPAGEVATAASVVSEPITSTAPGLEEVSPPTVATETEGETEERLPAKANELLIIFESGDLERTWATLILATSAAASGMKVAIFLTFWGFYPLVKPGAKVGDNWMQKMLSVMARPGIENLKLSRLNFMGMGPWMMKKLAAQYRVAEPQELLQIAQAMGVRLIPCQMTMDMFGLTRDDLIDGVEEPAGAATVLGMVADRVPAIFI
jgi:peroxiredoxin family protein